MSFSLPDALPDDIVQACREIMGARIIASDCITVSRDPVGHIYTVSDNHGPLFQVTEQQILEWEASRRFTHTAGGPPLTMVAKPPEFVTPSSGDIAQFAAQGKLGHYHGVNFYTKDKDMKLIPIRIESGTMDNPHVLPDYSQLMQVATCEPRPDPGEWQVTMSDDEIFVVTMWDELIDGVAQTVATCNCPMMAIPDMQDCCSHITAVLVKYGNPPDGRRLLPEIETKQEFIFAQGFVGPQLKTLRGFLKRNLPVLLFGPTGTGKSMVVQQACRENGHKLYSIVGSKGTRDYDLLGIYVRRGNSFVWEDGFLVKAMREGARFFLDELNRMGTEEQNIMMEVLTYNSVVVKEHGSEVVRAKPGFSVVAACNIGLEYVGTNAIDPALFSKFLRKIRFDYLDKNTETRLIKERIGLDAEISRRLAEIAQDTRASFRQGEYMAALNTRSLLEWAAEIANGELPVDAARSTFLYEIAGTLEQEQAISRLIREKFSEATLVTREKKLKKE